MIKRLIMQPRNHNSLSSTTSGRFAIGLLVSLSLVLVAFEWRSSERPVRNLVIEIPPEPAWESAPVFLIEEREPVDQGTSAKVAKKKQLALTEPSGPTDESGPNVDPDPIVGTTSGPSDEPIVSTGSELFVTERFPWHGKEVRPYFMDCLKRSPDALDECTEYRIQQHMQRRFRMPGSVRGEVRTTVTFEIDASGKVGRIAYTPRVRPEVEQEIERVLRELPVFVPGSQNGMPLPVIHRMPVVLSSR